MTQQGSGGLDHAALFAAVPAACVVLDPHLAIVTANDAYTEVTGRSVAELAGRDFFEVYPPEPTDPLSQGTEAHRRSLRAALTSGRPSMLLLHRFAITRPDGSGQFEPRWWNVVNQPVKGEDGSVELIIHRIDDVTDFVRSQEHGAGGPEDPEKQALRAELFSRAKELERTVSLLQEAEVRTRDVAQTLQRAMLSTPDLEDGHPDIAVRYRPALRGLNACGDWYDVVDLSDGRMALTVGDVVGHGVEAASIMGMLRSVLNAAVRVADSPSGALQTLGLYARAHDAAMGTTTFACLLIPTSRLLIYSNAGHPAPVLMHVDGTHDRLDQALDPPLGVRLEHVPRPQATVDYRDGDTLVLYTDGLIERRGEDIDVGVQRLVDALRAARTLPPGPLADNLLRVMADPVGQQDDISLLVMRL